MPLKNNYMLEKLQTEDVTEMEEINNLTQRAEDAVKLKSFSENSKLVSRPLWPQIFLSSLGTLHSLAASISASHSSILLPQLKSQNSSVPVDEYTASWIASSYAIAGPVGCLFGAINSDFFGRKKVTILGSLGMITGWILILVAQDNKMFIVARIVEGFSKGSLNTVLAVILDESSDPKYRGSILCIHFVSYALGVLIIAALGAAADWWTATLVSMVLPLTFLIVCIILPETPVWLVRNHRIEEARKVLLWFWGDHKIQVYFYGGWYKHRAQ